MPADNRIVFMGTPDFAAESLRHLVQKGFNIVGVVTAPDRPSGRGQKINQSAVKKLAIELKLPVLQPLKLRDPEFLSGLKEWAPDLIIVVAFRMLPEVVWALPPKGTINLHASLLPQYRGAAPINWAVINGEEKTGVTTFFINEKIDTGHILLQEEIPIDSKMSAGELHDILMIRGAGLLADTVKQVLNDEISPVPQDQIPSSDSKKSAPKLDKNNSRIQWKQPSLKVYNQIRGLSPYPGAWTIFKDSNGVSFRVKILNCERQKSKLLSPGQIRIREKKSIIIGTLDGDIQVLIFQPEGKRKMSPEEFLRGYRAEVISAQ